MMNDDYPLYELTITANDGHEDAIIEGDRTALTRLRDALNILLSPAKIDTTHVRHFIDGAGEEYDMIIRINEDL